VDRTSSRSSDLLARARPLAGVTLLWAALAMPAVARAAHPLITDDTGTLGKGNRQVELTAEMGRDEQRAEGVKTLEQAGETAFTFTFGLIDSIDLVAGAAASWSRVRLDGELDSNTAGFGDVALEVKWRFLELGGFSAALKPGLSLPTGDESRGLGNGRVSYTAAVILTQELGPVSVYANGAYARNEYALAEDRAANRSDVWHVSAAAAAEVLPSLQLAVNVGAETNPDPASDTWPAFALAGAIYSITDDLDVDLGVKVGLSSAEADVVGLGGIAWRF
jgi:hypothetical protein